MIVKTIYSNLINCLKLSKDATSTSICQITELYDSYGFGGGSLYVLIFTLLIIVSTLAYILSRGRNASLKRRRFADLPSRVFEDDEKNRVIVVGSGILGSSLATVLARDGRDVTLIERDMKEPDRIIGELLQPGGCHVLEKLGLKECLDSCEEAQTTTGYIIHDWKTGASVHIPYPQQQGLPSQSIEGKAFRHGKFISSLRTAALKEKNISVVEGTVQNLIEDNDVVTGVKYKVKGSDEYKEVHAPLVIVADGGFSKFRKQLHDDQVTVSSHFVGCIMKNCPQIKAQHAELVLSDPNPILIYRISDEETRVLVDIRCQTLPKNIREYLLEKTLPTLPGMQAACNFDLFSQIEHLAGPFEDGVINERIRSMPCKFLPPSTIRKSGVLMLGDAFNMRHPLTGGGMSVAFSDVAIWRDLLRDIPDLTNYRLIDESYTTFQNKRKMNHSFVVNVLAQALYELFSADDENLARLRDACFEYFKLGGSCVDGPVGLLSVLTPNPFVLIGHFFAVALYSMWLIVKQSGYRVHIGIYKAVRTFYKACEVIFPLLWTELRTIA